MKKLLVLVIGAALISGCGLIPDEQAIKKLLTEDLKVTAEPTDKGVKIYISGVPAELPTGLDGLSIYVTKDTANLGTAVKSGLKQDDSVIVENLVNGEENSVVVRGEVGGQVTAYGFSRGFYPRPGGFGDYMGYDPGVHLDDNGVSFDRTTGAPAATLDTASNTDFIFYRSGTDVYFSKRPGVTPGGVTASGKSGEEWLDVQDAPAGYSETVMLEVGKVYQFETADNYYGKIVVDSTTQITTVTAGEGDAVKVWLRYAFQTAQGVGHY